jgi:hypothetical protein
MQSSVQAIDPAIKYGEYLANTLPTSLPSRERGFASLSPRGRGTEGEGVITVATFNTFSRHIVYKIGRLSLWK